MHLDIQLIHNNCHHPDQRPQSGHQVHNRKPRLLIGIHYQSSFKAQEQNPPLATTQLSNRGGQPTGEPQKDPHLLPEFSTADNTQVNRYRMQTGTRKNQSTTRILLLPLIFLAVSYKDLITPGPIDKCRAQRPEFAACTHAHSRRGVDAHCILPCVHQSPLPTNQLAPGANILPVASLSSNSLAYPLQASERMQIRYVRHNRPQNVQGLCTMDRGRNLAAFPGFAITGKYLHTDMLSLPPCNKNLLHR